VRRASEAATWQRASRNIGGCGGCGGCGGRVGGGAGRVPGGPGDLSAFVEQRQRRVPYRGEAGMSPTLPRMTQIMPARAASMTRISCTVASLARDTKPRRSTSRAGPCDA
jgi:hypothetical protein